MICLSIRAKTQGLAGLQRGSGLSIKSKSVRLELVSIRAQSFLGSLNSIIGEDSTSRRLESQEVLMLFTQPQISSRSLMGSRVLYTREKAQKVTDPKAREELALML
jgi:hypothetical protein